MTQEELKQENEKLTARLKKAVEVFNEQKATITRQAEEIESLKQKAAEGEKKDNEFFEQVNEIEKLKESLDIVTKERDDLTARLTKAGSEYKKLQGEFETAKQVVEAEKAICEKLTNKINNLKAVLED